MQFPYDDTDNDLTFEQDVRKRLFAIETNIINLNAQCDLVQELIRKDLRTNILAPRSDVKKLSFTIYTVKTQEDTPVYIRISGRTYDIRDKIKQFGQANWRSELKAWELDYSEERYSNILQFLFTLTLDVTEESVVVTI